MSSDTTLQTTEAGVDTDIRQRDIVVGVDGSDESFAALRWALQEASLTGQRVNAVYGWTHSWDMGSEPDSEEQWAAMRHGTAKRLRDWVAQASSGMAINEDRVKLTSVRASGTAALLEIGKDAQQIVVGRRSLGRVARWFLGSLSASLAEEAKEPEKVMGKAIMGVVIGAGIIFAIVAYFSQIAWPQAYANIEDPDTGIFELFPHIGMSWLGTIFFIIDNCGSFVCALAGMGAVSRILYGMGRDNILPKKFFGKLSPKFQTPVNNIVLTTIIALTAIFYQDNVMGAASLVSFGAVCGFFMVNFSVVGHYIIRGKERGASAMIKHLVIPVIGMISLIVVFYFIETPAKILGGIWLLVGIVYLAVKTKGFRQLPPEMKIEE